MIIESQRILSQFFWDEPQETNKRIGTDFVCRIRFGNLLKDSGDILLCPIGEDFKPSNPLAHWVIEKEGTWLKRKIITLKYDGYIGTEHAAFIPCHKLKYRGIIFVSVDFYSVNRREINKKRIAEALILAQKYNCTKLSCPEGFLYPEFDYIPNPPPYEYLLRELNETIRTLNENDKINYMIDFVIKRSIKNSRRLRYSLYTYDNYTKAFFERFPVSAEILPWYRKRMKSIKRIYAVGPVLAYMIHHVLSDETVSTWYICLISKILTFKFGWYLEDDPGITCNKGGIDFLLDFCSEMPWNYFRLRELLYKNNEDDKKNPIKEFYSGQRWYYRCHKYQQYINMTVFFANNFLEFINKHQEEEK